MTAGPTYHQQVALYDKVVILRALNDANGNIADAADSLALALSTFKFKLRAHDLPVELHQIQRKAPRFRTQLVTQITDRISTLEAELAVLGKILAQLE